MSAPNVITKNAVTPAAAAAAPKTATHPLAANKGHAHHPRKGGVGRRKGRGNKLAVAGLADLKKLVRLPPLVVSESSTGDTKSDPRSTLRHLMKSAGMKGLGNVRVWLWYASSDSTSGAGAQQAPVNRIRPSDAAEFTFLASLYDEYKGLAVHTYYGHAITAASVATDCVMVYDPTDPTGLTTITAGLGCAVKKFTRNNNSFAQPAYQSSDGFAQMEFKIPSGPSVEVASGVPGPGVWVDTSVTSYDVGWLKSVITAPTAAVTTTLRQYIGIYTEFRMRS